MRCKRISAWFFSAVLLFSSLPVVQLLAADTAAVKAAGIAANYWSVL